MAHLVRRWVAIMCWALVGGLGAYAMHNRFAKIFEALKLGSMEEWSADVQAHMALYLRGEIVPGDSQATRSHFWILYNTSARHLTMWWKDLPQCERPAYERYAIPDVTTLYMKRLAKRWEVQNDAKDRRKKETDAIVPHFAEIRAEAHFRFNQVSRIRAAMRAAIAGVEDGTRPLPCRFAYDEGGDPDQGTPHTQRLHFRLWDRRTFTLSHPEGYSPPTLTLARKGQGPYAPERNGYLLEYVGVTSLTEGPAEGLWFADILENNATDPCVDMRSVEDRARLKEWLASWGYGENGQVALPFKTHTPGLLAYTQRSGDWRFIAKARQVSGKMFIPVEGFYAASHFALLAIHLFTEKGARINEAIQIRPTRDCIARIERAAPPEAQDQRRRVSYALRLIPKGERRDKPSNYYIGAEAVRLLSAVGVMVRDHYGLAPGSPLPTVKYSQRNGRSHRFPPAPYLFQHGGVALGGTDIASCMRFLLHGMVFLDADGEKVIVKPHLLRHAFATYAVRILKLPLDLVGAMMHHKSLEVTAYYSAPTHAMTAEAADSFIDEVAMRVSVEETKRTGPKPLQMALADAEAKVGTHGDVLGGTCSMDGECQEHFQCVGCKAKVVDPARKDDVQDHKEWNLRRADELRGRGLAIPAAQHEEQAHKADAELKEMGMIDAYRRDELRAPDVVFEP